MIREKPHTEALGSLQDLEKRRMGLLNNTEKEMNTPSGDF